MKNKGTQLTLEEAQENISSFKWERYQRDFEPETTHLKEVYWTIVAQDLLTMSDEDWQTVRNQFYRSFFGIFYKVNELNHRLQCCFSGISRFEWNEKKDQLKSWDERLGKIVSSELIILRENVWGFNQTGKIHLSQPKESIALRQFDHYHKQLDQPVSYYLCKHLRYQGQGHRKKVPVKIPVVIKIKKPVIAELQKRGDAVLRANATHSIIKHVEQGFALSDTLIHDTRRQASYPASTQRLRQVFNAYVKVTGPTQAYNNLVASRSKCKQLSNQALTDIIMRMYRDENGQLLKRNSVIKTIRSIRKK